MPNVASEAIHARTHRSRVRRFRNTKDIDPPLGLRRPSVRNLVRQAKGFRHKL
jgi:hypothetical protein